MDSNQLFKVTLYFAHGVKIVLDDLSELDKDIILDWIDQDDRDTTLAFEHKDTVYRFNRDYYCMLELESYKKRRGSVYF